jgi:hypothetical protein
VDDSTTIPFVFPEVAGRKVLVLGLGGGCDILTAYAFAQLLDVGPSGAVVYANTKTGWPDRLTAVTRHIRRVSGPVLAPGQKVRGLGNTQIDHSVPRGPDGCPWIFVLGDEEALADEIGSLGFDIVFGVDTGGDSIASKAGRGYRGRDQRMLRVLCRTGLPLFHVVIAPGCDGEASASDLQEAFVARAAANLYRGCFPLAPLLPVLRPLSEPLSARRTPRIILAAADGELTPNASGLVVVPRGKEPAVSLSWLTHGFVFATTHEESAS